MRAVTVILEHLLAQFGGAIMPLPFQSWGDSSPFSPHLHRHCIAGLYTSKILTD